MPQPAAMINTALVKSIWKYFFFHIYSWIIIQSEGWTTFIFTWCTTPLFEDIDVVCSFFLSKRLLCSVISILSTVRFCDCSRNSKFNLSGSRESCFDLNIQRNIIKQLVVHKGVYIRYRLVLELVQCFSFILIIDNKNEDKTVLLSTFT